MTALPTAALCGLLRKMLIIRRSEEALAKLFAEGSVPGFIHLSIGQEAIPTAVCAQLAAGDTIASTHRGHGHAIAKGIELTSFFAEILGRQSGICKGRGGSIHVADVRIGMLGANGIVGGSLSIAVGSALAHQTKATDNIAIAFFGDGAIAEGILHESLNLSALWKLPVLFVCENNRWAEFSPGTALVATRLKDLAAAFGIGFADADGSDICDVHSAAAGLIDKARHHGGPQILECHTERWRGHFEGDPQRYRASEDAASAKVRDPIAITIARLTSLGVSHADIQLLEQETDVEVAGAVERARSGPPPDFASARGDVYAAQRR